MTYPETIRYLGSFINYEKLPAYPYKESCKPERIRDFLQLIGNPQDSLKCLHIAGSKGKGSTCAFLTYILSQAGFKVGLYTSPHLSDFRERIRILRPISDKRYALCDFAGMITKSELADLVQRLKPVIEKYNRNSSYGPLSFFEVYTALAFLYFKKKKVDFAVLETGLGGRLDATNIVNPLACGITSISYEHTQKLGKSLREIAAEKAGIIKRQKVIPRLRSGQAGKRQKLIVISAPQARQAQQVIRQRCKETGAKLYEVGCQIKYTAKGKSFRVKGIFGDYSGLKTRLLGEHQRINAAVAIGLIETLRQHKIKVDAHCIRKGISGTLWPGRCEVISRDPLVVLDGAQNLASAKALKEAIKENFKYKKLILVLGISSDKDIAGICREFYDLADELILTRADNPRAARPEVLAGYFSGRKKRITQSVKEAKAMALDSAGKEDLILVSGSLFLVGEFR